MLFTLAACGDGITSFAPGQGSAAGPGVLAVLGPSSIVVAPRGTTNLRVSYRDGAGQPVMRVNVEFVLEGMAPAVSLSAEQAETDAEGIASVRLTAGSDSASFRVRANADGVEPVYIDVEVLESAVRKAQVEAHYMGLRNVVSRTLTAFTGMGCEAALAARTEGDLTQSYEDPEGSVEFELGPGLQYAFVGLGRDASGALLADGCDELNVPVDPTVGLEALVVELLDRPFTLAGSYDVSLGFDVAASAARAGDTAIAGGEALLTSVEAPGANYLLDAIDRALRDSGLIGDADKLVTSRLDGSLASSLEGALGAAKAGPEEWLSAFSTQLRRRGSALFLDASYGVTSVAGVPMSLTLTSMESRTVQGPLSILEYGAMSLPASAIDAQYDDARAVIAVDTLSVQLALGTYALRVLDAIEMVEDGGVEGLLAESSGCAELATWAADEPLIASACNDACVQAACASAIDALHMQARTQLAALDVDHPSIGVRGELLVFDRDEDGIVDEIGEASFEGSWGQAPNEEKADAVDADFSVTGNLNSP